MKASVAAVMNEFVRRYRTVRAQSGRARRWPVGAVLIAIGVFVTAIATRPFFSTIDHATYFRLGWTAQTVIAGDWWKLVSAIGLSRDPFMTLSMMASILVVVGFYERMVGTLRALWVSIGGAVLGYAGITLGLALAQPLASAFVARTIQSLDVGFSSGIAASYGGMVAAVRYPPATRILVGIVIAGLIVHHQIADWEHAVSAFSAYFVLRTLGPTYSDQVRQTRA